MGRLFVYSLVAAFVLLMMMGCGEDSASQHETTESNGTEQDSTTGPASSNTARTGEELFSANCSVCHGVDAFGTNQGPPLVDKTYHPGHHPDFSIRNAINKGVKQHHWFFGDMPPVAGVSPDDAEKIICHIRGNSACQRPLRSGRIRICVLSRTHLASSSASPSRPRIVR